ncbi:hypothetical protein [Flavobacterium sp. 7A]|uniref:hypothetical protein n=1 Tax=Flavobacterium sp. 7A TaxID=2940571 RepID=UPI00222666F2|nr:hypothetical protein [Flavobacterium sp. 7A]MCW2118584.1 flagellar basal body-associated protein FliL [Flavobacterium sp. 7A]
MKIKILSLAIITLLAGTIVISCGKKNKEDAEAVKADVTEMNKDLEKGAMNTGTDAKETVSEDWQKFEASSKLTIKSYNYQIKELRTKIATADKEGKTKLSENLDKLEQKNKELKEKLDLKGKELKENVQEMDQAAKDKEVQFEREFQHDMDEMGTSLNDFFKDNIK